MTREIAPKPFFKVELVDRGHDHYGMAPVALIGFDEFIDYERQFATGTEDEGMPAFDDN